MHAVAVSAVARLIRDGAAVYICPQIAAEFWNTTTRPVEANSRGLSPAEALDELQAIEGFFQVLADGVDAYAAWKRLVATHGVRGVQVHDARLAALMEARGLEAVLTFNSRDFRRLLASSRRSDIRHRLLLSLTGGRRVGEAG